jgi:hypothetical protein
MIYSADLLTLADRADPDPADPDPADPDPADSEETR